MPRRYEEALENDAFSPPFILTRAPAQEGSHGPELSNPLVQPTLPRNKKVSDYHPRPSAAKIPDRCLRRPPTKPSIAQDPGTVCCVAALESGGSACFSSASRASERVPIPKVVSLRKTKRATDSLSWLRRRRWTGRSRRLFCVAARPLPFASIPRRAWPRVCFLRRKLRLGAQQRTGYTRSTSLIASNIH